MAARDTEANDCDADWDAVADGMGKESHTKQVQSNLHVHRKDCAPDSGPLRQSQGSDSRSATANVVVDGAADGSETWVSCAASE